MSIDEWIFETKNGAKAFGRFALVTVVSTIGFFGTGFLVVTFAPASLVLLALFLLAYFFWAALPERK